VGKPTKFTKILAKKQGKILTLLQFTSFSCQLTVWPLFRYYEKSLRFYRAAHGRRWLE
jgi:hypothetical protein